MADPVPRQLKLRRDLKANIPDLAEGEPFYCTDTKELFIGSESDGNVKMDIQYTPAVPASWAGADPENLVEAMDRAAALLVSLNGGPIP